jgi:NADPH:quinone reductase-like Zn-dependent oxidoreductase
MVGAPKKLSSLPPRLLTGLAWYALFSQKFAFFIARMKPADMALLCELVEHGKLSPVIGRRYALSDTAAAIAHVEEGHASGKVVINIEPE